MRTKSTLALVLAMPLLASPLAAQDRRKVEPPVEPRACATLHAVLAAPGGGAWLAATRVRAGTRRVPSDGTECRTQGAPSQP